MEAKEYKDKCSKLLEKFEQSDDNYDEVFRDFRHLVYAFDSGMPLNAELDEEEIKSIFRMGSGKYSQLGGYEKMVGYMKFFIHYIEDYKGK